MSAIVPIPTQPMDVRVATMSDLPFIDALQKQHAKNLGYFPTKQFEGYIEMGAVLIAEGRHEGTEARRHEVVKGREEAEVNSLGASVPSPSLRASVPSCLRASPVGYCITRDRYLKRDELGVIYQLCVSREHQRGLIGAALIREVFARSAYGCKLYCCWCAQDLAANHFWESMGFVPLAFRAGSTGKRRVHIFWQRRINDGDAVTPWWYPCQTNAGAIRADRLVFPIPPGTHWKDVTAVAVPAAAKPALPALPAAAKSPRKPKPRLPKGPLTTASIGLRFGPAPAPEVRKEPKAPTVATPKAKIDPKLTSAARELRDRYLERVNDEAELLSAGKYEVARALPAPAGAAGGRRAIAALPAAA